MVRLIALAIALWVAGSDGVTAQTFFARIEKITLPDGSSGELRLVSQDAILIGPERARIWAIGQDRRLLALSDQSRSITLVCAGWPRRCQGYDRNTLQILKLDPHSFRQGGPVVDRIAEGDDIDPKWIAEGTGESWGFSRRLAPPPIIARALLDEAVNPLAFFGFALVALSSAVAGFVASLKSIGNERWRVVVRIVQFVANASLVVVAALTCLLAYFVFEASIPLITTSLLFGGTFGAMVLWIWERLCRMAAPKSIA